MFPFYDDVIAPLLAASGAKRILEIGIRRGATTAQLLRRLGPGVEVHAIDPVPDFDAAELARTFPGRYVVHAATSHDVLPSLGAFDVALIDGDHNWFTVYHELRMLADGARAAATDLPIFVLHDVGWPYGRRDLYYAPARIPPEFRHEFARRGLQPGHAGFVSSGGMNASFDNAAAEGGARNGVMTAVDDFVAECDEPVRVVVLPIYFGLAIVVSEARLRGAPDVVTLLDWLESKEGKQRLLELSESIRLRAMTHQQNALARAGARTDGLAMQYVELLRATLTSSDEAAAVRLAHLTPVLDALPPATFPVPSFSGTHPPSSRRSLAAISTRTISTPPGCTSSTRTSGSSRLRSTRSRCSTSAIRVARLRRRSSPSSRRASFPTGSCSRLPAKPRSGCLPARRVLRIRQ
jgi:hypothetical protein